MAVTIFTDIDKGLTTLVSGMTNEVMGNLITNITPIVLASLVLYFIMYGYAVLNQNVNDSFQDFARQLFKVGIITSIALAGGIYQSHIADIIINLPDTFAKLAFSNADNTYSVADKMLEMGLKKSGEMLGNSSILHPSDSIGYCISAFIIICCCVFLGGAGGALLIMVKIMASILASIGPLFIVALLFKPIQGYFKSWLDNIIQYAIFGLILTVIFTFFLQMADFFVSNIKSEGIDIWSATGQLFALTLVGLILIWASHKIALSISSGISGAYSLSAGTSTASDIVSKKIEDMYRKMSKNNSSQSNKSNNIASDNPINPSWRKR